ncbi:type II CRISPR RNA-guided endonuclease Cas9 [Zavarzinia compransoris]|uniref:CRISPR-associated endonuclease Cas9 n=1 Tax=Zavarzinia compransoris TaxID=1264899 RepID=A0A317EBX5_9PROT|nr:type II CRISPR RNA-guided endonuclease Cas9 [Zavarzinia compransoris]
MRIFHDGREAKSRKSSAVARRVARGMRRRRDRYVRRRAALLQALVDYGLMPADEGGRKALEALDPYDLRVAGLDGPLPLHHFGRVIFHLDQRRGFKSNRKSEKGDGEAGLIKQAATRLKAAMAEEKARTLGEFLHHRRLKGETVRVRLKGAGAKASPTRDDLAGGLDGDGRAKASYDFYPTRDLIEVEFDTLWAAQAAHHPELTAAVQAALARIIFYQRPLRSPPPGKCALLPARDKDDLEGYRAPRAHPLAQHFRVWQEVRNLRIEMAGTPQRRLMPEEGELVGKALLAANSLSFDKMRALLKLPAEARFNLESEKRDRLKGDETAERLAAKKIFGKDWRHFPPAKQWAIVDRLLNEEDEPTLIDWLVTEAGASRSVAAAAAGTALPDGYGRLGLRALKILVPLMAGGLSYDEACVEGLGKSHSVKDRGDLLPRLPYYGQWLQDDVVGTGDPWDTPEKRFGRLPNPTVHIGLGQVRRIVNALIDRYGPPAQVVVEMTRDFKLSPRQLAEVEKEQAANQRRNDARREKLAELGVAVNARNLLKLRLWEELSPRDSIERDCPFTPEKIGLRRLFSENGEVEIEHLIPFSISFDDSAANKTVALRRANRDKGNRTPWQAFHNDPRYDWPGIAARAAQLPKNKRWRFAPDALERFGDEEGFLARQLNETGWLARMAKDYLSAVTPANQVWVIPGRLTALLRAKWGLNGLLPNNYGDSKSRLDHRHHAIDALVAALTSRRLLLLMASTYDEERDRIVVPLPLPDLHDSLSAWRDRMTVSHKADHGAQAGQRTGNATSGRLHEETAYGLVRDPAAEDGMNLVYRKTFEALTEAELPRIRDRRLRDLVAAHWAEAKPSGQKLADALGDFARMVKDPHIANGIRRVRILKKEKAEFLVAIAPDGGGPAYKAYAAGDNAFIDIIETADGKWIGEATSVFSANTPSNQPAWRQWPDASFVMRVFKGDLLRLNWKGRDCIMIVRRLDAAANRFKLALHCEAGSLDKRHDAEDDPFEWLMASYSTLKAMGAQKVRVDELGTVWRLDPADALKRL